MDQLPISSSYPRPRNSSRQKPLPNGSARMARRGSRIDMERLRVEAAGEVEDLLLADGLLAELEDLAFAEVFQVSHLAIRADSCTRCHRSARTRHHCDGGALISAPSALPPVQLAQLVLRLAHRRHRATPPSTQYLASSERCAPAAERWRTNH